MAKLVTKTQTELARDLVSHNIDWVEEAILVNAVRRPDFWRALCAGKINTTEKGISFEDWSKTYRTLIYNAASQYYAAVGVATALQPDVLLNLLVTELKESRCLPDDFKVAAGKLKDIFAVDLAQFADFVEIAVPHWLNRRRTVQLAARVPTSKSLEARQLLEQLNNVVKATDDAMREEIPTFEQYIQSALTGSNEVKQIYPLISLGRFNSFLGGGLVAGEAGLIIIPSGGGKTVLANQMAADLALSEVRVLLATTEQSYDEMYVRQLSAQCNIDFDLLNRGLDPAKLGPAQIQQIVNYQKRVQPFLRIEDLSRNPADLANELGTILKRWQGEDFPPQVMILDWLGCGLDFMDGGERSNYMSGLIKKLREECRSHQVSLIVFAQGHPDHTKNKKFIVGSDATGCKSLHVYADWGAGISLLTETGMAEGTTNQPMIKRTQVVNFFKTRLAPPGHMLLDRDFKYQRWKITEDFTQEPLQNHLGSPG